MSLDLLGTWFWGPVPHLLRAQAGGLLHLGPLPGRSGRASRFAARADGTFVGLDGYYAGETLRIAPDHLELATFVFTRTPYDPEAPVPGGVDEAGDAGGDLPRAGGEQVGDLLGHDDQLTCQAVRA